MSLETYKHLFKYFGLEFGVSQNVEDLSIAQTATSVDTCKGFKVAFLKDLLNFKFTGYSYGDFSTDSKFECFYKYHEYPTLNCTCGFYSFKSIDDAKKLLAYREGAVLLEVEHYGEIIEHAKGYRAAEQEILSIYYPSVCHRILCKSTAEGVTQRYTNWLQVCRKHSADKFYSFKELRSLIPVEVNIL